MTAPHAIFNFGLISISAAVTLMVLNHDFSRATVAELLDRKRSSVEMGKVAPPNLSNAGNNKDAVPNVSIIYERTIFNPMRTERLSMNDDSEDSTTRKPLDMELIGIGVVDDAAAAVINFSNRQNNKLRRKSQSAKKQTRHVYRLGQRIENTGYKITDITLNEVILNRGDEERVLRLQKSDSNTVARKKAATRHAEALRRRQSQAADQQEASAPPPPRPLGEVPEGLKELAEKQAEVRKNDNKDTEMTPEERTAKARQRIREILEKRRKAKAQQTN
ncbi:MAG: hypothetical protein R6V56_03735 [Lentisphaeria bacterium]